MFNIIFYMTVLNYIKKADIISATQSIYIVLFKDSTILTAKKDT